MNKKIIAAVGAAAIIGVAGYGVYATTLNVQDTSTSFAAGAASVNQVDGFGQMSVNTGSPVFNPNAPEKYSLERITLTPTGTANWSNVDGKTVTVTAYAEDNTELYDVTYQVPGDASGQDAVNINLPANNDANAVYTWGVVVQ